MGLSRVLRFFSTSPSCGCHGGASSNSGGGLKCASCVARQAEQLYRGAEGLQSVSGRCM